MKKLSQVQKAIVLPLMGEVWGWLFFMAALYSNQVDNQSDYGTAIYVAGQTNNRVHLGTYLFLIAIAGFSVFALAGQKTAVAARVELGEQNALGRAAQRFATLAVVLALAFGVIYAFGNFMGAFGYGTSNADNAAARILDVYLPILLSTALVVWVLLSAFVFRAGDHQDGEKDKRGLTEAQKALGLGYALPILTTAFAIILGLIVFDVTKTGLQVWVWVLIQAIVVGGVVLGTKFAAKAKLGVVRPPRERRALAAGAAGLNFVLSVVFGGVVSIMSFSYGGAAIDKLQHFPQYDVNGKPIGGAKVTIDPISITWFINEMFPALVLLGLVVVGIYWTLIARNSEPRPQSNGGK